VTANFTIDIKFHFNRTQKGSTAFENSIRLFEEEKLNVLSAANIRSIRTNEIAMLNFYMIFR
jgi:hypothetical protein